ncbi:MAG: DUF4442 domain-containing protein [Chitinophagales bacterium]
MKKLFPTTKTESRRTRVMRWIFNVWPCIWCTGSKVTFIAGDFTELHVRLTLNWRTRNRVGTVFGGSIYSSVDPYYMLLLMEALGRDYVVWDKAASMKFVRPISKAVKCRFLIAPELLTEIREKTQENGQYIFDLPLQFEDEEGKVYAVFTKTTFVATKAYYKQKKAAQDGTTAG